jgi:hypothetical protein
MFSPSEYLFSVITEQWHSISWFDRALNPELRRRDYDLYQEMMTTPWNEGVIFH